MRSVPQATVIELTQEERKAPQALASPRKSGIRMRDRARIVLLAASGVGSRGIAREVSCTPGTASTWRVRYARGRLAGLSETGDAVVLSIDEKSSIQALERAPGVSETAEWPVNDRSVP